MTALPGIEHHPHARAVLEPALPPGAASHAYLFSGPAGAGKRGVARAFAAALLADGSPDPPNTTDRVSRDSHPDLVWVTPSGAAEMLVSDIDEPVVAAAQRRPFESRRRVFVIEQADAMNEATANRMLKTLEEPPDYAHLILITDRPGDLLPTIASRCQHVRFDALTVPALAAMLEQRGVSSDQAQACARLALGDGERATALALGDGPALRAAAERLARAPLAGETAAAPWSGLLQLAKAQGERVKRELDERLTGELELTAKADKRRVTREHEERGRRQVRRAETAALDLGLSLSGLWYRDLAAIADGAGELIHAVDRRSELEGDAAGRDRRSLRAAVELVDETRRRLTLNVTEDLALEALTYRLARTVS